MLGVLVGLVVRQFRSRTSLIAENELLRQQLAAAKSRLVADDGDAGAAGHCASVAPGGLPPSMAMVVTTSRPKADTLRDADPRDGGAKPKVGRPAASR